MTLRIYTKTGDDGTTGLFGGERVLKSAPLLEAYGGVDELNASLGLAYASGLSPRNASLVERLQEDLMVVGSDLATPLSVKRSPIPRLAESEVLRLESWIDELEATLEPLQNFVLPGGALAAAQLHVCRTVCRRVERRVVELQVHESRLGVVLRYLNRLSDLLFVMTRVENQHCGLLERPWAPRHPLSDKG